MGTKPKHNITNAKPAAAKKTRPAQAPTRNFILVGEPHGAPTTIETLLRFARIEPRGRNRWYVEARPLEWVLVPGHIVWLMPSGLQCDCRQGIAGRECDHVLAVRHLGTIKPQRAGDPRQLRLVDDVEPTVRVEVPRGRYRVEYHVAPWCHVQRPVRPWERAEVSGGRVDG